MQTSTSQTPTETEVKIRVPDRSQIASRLETCGFVPSAARVFESNTIYDTFDQSLHRAGMILRLRQAGEHFVITWKGPGVPGRYKARPELETTIGSLHAMHQILDQLGYSPSFRYEKYRTEFVHGLDPTRAVVTLDETPIGDFLELEGPGDWIDATARQLGFSRQDYVLDSYGKLYLAECERRGVEPSHMVFASQSK